MNRGDEPSRALPVEVGAQPLAALIARAEAATGPDRGFDCLLGNLDRWRGITEADALAWTTPYEADPTGYAEDRYTTTTADRSGVPDYTTSTDAALALVKRALPGWTVAQISQDDSKHWHAELREGYLTSYNRVAMSGLYPKGSPLPALALILALLRALQAQPNRHNARDGATPQSNEPSK